MLIECLKKYCEIKSTSNFANSFRTLVLEIFYVNKYLLHVNRMFHTVRLASHDIRQRRPLRIPDSITD